jgi:hypothetical protein
VTAVRNHDFGFVIAFFAMVSLHDQQTGQLALSSGSWLQSNGVHAGDFSERIFEGLEHLQSALYRLFWLLRVQVGETWQACHVFINLGVIFHGAGPERVEANINAVVQAGKSCEMPNDVEFRHRGQRQFFAQKAGRNMVSGINFGNIECRQRKAAAAIF